ncbi:MAG: response regulator transcription factor [Syntrophales bacterium]|nr:response regulator transcription factor [Syntrophales bacterium]MDD5641296.1 response regulator transcription factor [Syntrophales bacterium]
METYRLLLADDHLIFREMIKKSLDEIPGLEVVGEASDGLELLKLIDELHPHMVIIDIGMPYKDGVEVAKEIKRSQRGIKILLLTMYKSKDHVHRSLEAGVDGYILKDNAFKDLITAIKSIREGKPYISDLVIGPLLEGFHKKSRPSAPEELGPLSPRELEVLKYFAGGKTTREISTSLLIKESTVRIHLKNIKLKLQIKDNIDLVRYALKHGYASLT